MASDIGIIRGQKSAPLQSLDVCYIVTDSLLI